MHGSHSPSVTRVASLDHEGCEDEPAHSVEYVNMGWNVLAGDVILDRMSTETVVKPTIHACWPMI